MISAILSAVAHPQPSASTPISDVHYTVTVDSTTVIRRAIDVAMDFRVDGDGPLVLSLPAWSPGHYTLLWFARRMSHLRLEANGAPLYWRLVDAQTWRVTGARKGQRVTVRFSYLADTIDRAVAWTKPDFAFFNGTNLFLYPVGVGFDWPATVTIHTSASWRIATGLEPTATPRTFGARNYHDLVDAPFFIGHFDLDSTAFGSGWIRFANYPAALLGSARLQRALSWLAMLARVESGIFHVTPWRTYTVLQIVDAHPNDGGLEHHNSQLDEIPTGWLDAPLVPWDYAHEMFHAWNVKRLRPADLTPYRYDRAQPTPWLWMCEGVSDYYTDLAITRSGIGDSTRLLERIGEYIAEVETLPPTALTDASIRTWIAPTDGTAFIYYPKGALAGFMLDVLIRDASNDRRSLDDVLRALYERTYRHGRGFTSEDWWTAVETAAAGRSFAGVNHRFIEGRDRVPWDSIMPLAALRLVTDTVRDVDLGFADGRLDSLGLRVVGVVAGGPADRGGIQNNDILVSIGDVPFTNITAFAMLQAALRSRLGGSGHATYIVQREGQRVTGEFPIVLIPHVQTRVEIAPDASPKARRILHAIFTGG
jgi:predicted metalloprotease with PDZ domain